MRQPVNYYNEFDPHAAQWLRNLIAAGLIPAGDVDERSIEDVRPNDLRGYTQCHFFAGIGGWPIALDLAGWPRDMPVWTGSCPCQPFSTAGKGDGFADQRHLWPAWFHLIRECRPERVFGEQVASAIGHGWFDLVSADLEAEDYAIGGAVLGAHSVGAPHIRQRLYWVADSQGMRRRKSHRDEHSHAANQETGQPCDGIKALRLGSTSGAGLSERVCDGARARKAIVSGSCAADGLAESYGAGLQPWQWDDQAAGHGDTATATGGDDRHTSAGAINSPWRVADWLRCQDGRWRPVEAGTFPLAHGVFGRVGKLRAYGNAIVPQAAAEWNGGKRRERKYKNRMARQHVQSVDRLHPEGSGAAAARSTGLLGMAGRTQHAGRRAETDGRPDDTGPSLDVDAAVRPDPDRDGRHTCGSATCVNPYHLRCCFQAEACRAGAHVTLLP